MVGNFVSSATEAVLLGPCEHFNVLSHASSPPLVLGSGSKFEAIGRGGKKGGARRWKHSVKTLQPKYNYALGKDVGCEMIM